MNEYRHNKSNKYFCCQTRVFLMFLFKERSILKKKNSYRVQIEIVLHSVFTWARSNISLPCADFICSYIEIIRSSVFTCGLANQINWKYEVNFLQKCFSEHFPRQSKNKLDVYSRRLNPSSELDNGFSKLFFCPSLNFILYEKLLFLSK